MNLKLKVLMYFPFRNIKKGPGLFINPYEKGTIVAITCGYPVMFFLDFALYLLRMNIQIVGHTRKKHYAIFGNEVFDRFNAKSFKFILFSSFKENTEVIGEKIFKKLSEISEKYGINNFEYHLRVSKTGEPRWNEETYRKFVPIDAKKIFIIGPLGATENIREQLCKIGIKDINQFATI